jgi:excisionase family DNA binding protein
MSRDGVNALNFPTNPSGLALNSDLRAIYLTPTEVAEMLKLSTKSVYRIAQADPSMPMLKFGGSVRFPKERLLRWLHQREQGRPLTSSLSAISPKSAPDKAVADE